MTAEGLTRCLQSRAVEGGATLFGVTDRIQSAHLDHFRGWLDAGMHGSMAYLERPDGVSRRADLNGTVAGVRSVVVVGVNYAPSHSSTDVAPSDRAIIARYALGRDYHDVLPPLLGALASELDLHAPGHSSRAYVDTGPILERELAREAGLGWFGKNTMLIHPEQGSWFVLGVLLTSAQLEVTEPFAEDRCGTCRACLDACPTGALLGRDTSGAPVLDARRCISYLTIEAKGPIPVELRPQLGGRVFGCDICQEVCPWNERFAQPSRVSAFHPRAELDGVTLVALTERLLAMSEKGYQRSFRDSPLSRPRRKGMLRNLCVGLGNALESFETDPRDEVAEKSAEIRAILERALADAQPLVRAHAAWALGRSGNPDARRALTARLAEEQDDDVRREITTALGD